MVDDYASTRHGAYDLYEIDQNGNLVRDQNGLPIILATVSQTEFVTECSLTSCSTTRCRRRNSPLHSRLFRSCSRLTSRIMRRRIPIPAGTAVRSRYSAEGSQQNPQLIQLNGTQRNSTRKSGPARRIDRADNYIRNSAPAPPPRQPRPRSVNNTLVEYYFYPNFGTNYFTSTDFIPPASDIEANPDLGGAFFLSVTDNSITASDFTFNGTFTSASFNGFEVVDLTGNPDISGRHHRRQQQHGRSDIERYFLSILNAVWVNW